MRVCDVCKRFGVEARTYTISEGGRQMEADLCGEDAQPVEAILQAVNEQVEASDDAEQGASAANPRAEEPKVAKSSPARKSAPRAKKAAAKKSPSRRLPVKTVAEIEASKRK
ncbi:hypothetical protein [Streptomyces chrestomyceticus]|uniref:hypothetical protein n=1 Tax=Streptomyces chrestomyceticus TaxID=68185 RepID=UPI0033EC825F